MKKKKKIKEDVSGIEVQNVSDGIKFREYEFIDVVKPEPMKSPKNNITWTEARDEYGDSVDGPKISKKEKKKNLASEEKDEKITRSEAKAPEGLMKLAATVAANNKKRKNALQIQKYIGEDAKMGRMSDDDLAAAHKKFSGMDQTSPANKFMTKRIQKEIDKRKKVNEETIVEKQGGDKKKPDTRVNYRTAFTQDRVLNSTPDEERGAAKRKSTAEMIRQKKRDEIQRKKEAFQKKRKGLMAKGQIKSKQ